MSLPREGRGVVRPPRSERGREASLRGFFGSGWPFPSAAALTTLIKIRG